MPKKFHDDSWMYEKPRCPFENPSKKTQAKYDHRPLPRLPSHWPTDKLSKVITRPDGIRQLSHPDRDTLVLSEHRWEWVEPMKLDSRRRRHAP